MSKFKCALCLCVIVSLLVNINECKKKKKFQRDHTVLILNDKNFNKTINHFKSLLVEFTTNWCGPFCESFSQDVTTAAIQLYKLKPRLNVGRIYLNDNKETEKMFEFRRYPTLKYFHNGIAEDYTGTNSISGMIKWMLKKNSPPLTELLTLSEIANFKNTHEASVIYFGDDSTHKKYLEELGTKDSDNFYAFCDFQTAYTNYNAKKGMVVLYRDYGEERTELYGKLTMNGIRNFVDKYSKNKILTLTDNTVKFVWEDKHPALILFSDKSNKNYDAYERMLKSVAEEIYGRITIINAGINENNEIHLLPIMSVDKTKLPAVRIIDTRDEYQRKIYELEGIINEKSIITFVNDWENERLKVMLKTENIPNDYEQSQQNGVFKVVSKTFKKEVLNYKKNVFMFFYSKHNSKCKEVLPDIERLAKTVKEDDSVSEILRVAKFDSSANELDNFKMEEYPKIILYMNNKQNIFEKDAIKFDEKEKNYNTFIKFINDKLNTTLLSDEDEKSKEDL